VIQFGGVDILELVGINDDLIGLPVFLGAIVEKAGAHEVLGFIGTYLVNVIEHVGARDIPSLAASTFRFNLTERAGAHDVPGAPIETGILVIESAAAHDAGSALTDLWVPVDDSQSGIWVPVNDNPTSPWLPVTP
jgi:hypothetical protein